MVRKRGRESFPPVSSEKIPFRFPPRRYFGAAPICRQACSSHGRHQRAVSSNLLRSSGISEVEGELPITSP